MTFPEKLVIARKQIGLTQDELAKLSGIPNTSICKFETGEREPSLSSFKKIVLALRVSADYLLDINLADLWMAN
jgi:transcriptional regulator with XRE-family HTH domain